MVQLIEKIKNTAGGFHSWWESDVGIIRKPNNSIKEPKIMEENAKYSLKKGIIKGIKYFVIFLIPVLIAKLTTDFAPFFQLTLGGLLVILYNYLKIAVLKRLP